jgi:predicted regulator of Ras-like GTPase activity (Roadblock/LC7/MglB family)
LEEELREKLKELELAVELEEKLRGILKGFKEKTQVPSCAIFHRNGTLLISEGLGLVDLETSSMITLIACVGEAFVEKLTQTRMVKSIIECVKSKFLIVMVGANIIFMIVLDPKQSVDEITPILEETVKQIADTMQRT